MVQRPNKKAKPAPASHDQIAPLGEDHDESKQIDPAGEGQIVRWEAPRMSLAQLLDDAKANATQGTAHDHTYEEPQQGEEYTCCMVTRSHVGDSALAEGWKQVRDSRQDELEIVLTLLFSAVEAAGGGVDIASFQIGVWQELHQ